MLLVTICGLVAGSSRPRLSLQTTLQLGKISTGLQVQSCCVFSFNDGLREKHRQSLAHRFCHRTHTRLVSAYYCTTNELTIWLRARWYDCISTASSNRCPASSLSSQLTQAWFMSSVSDSVNLNHPVGKWFLPCNPVDA